MYRFLIFPLIVMMTLGCAKDEEMAQIGLTWELIRNTDEGFEAAFEIENTSGEVLTAKNWKLYYNQITGVPDPASFPEGITVRRITGDFWEISPTEVFKELAEGEKLRFTYKGNGFINKESWGPLGAYFVIDGIANPAEYSVKPFEKPEQLNRGSKDLVPIPTSEWLYAQNENLKDIPETDLPPVMPTPVKWERLNKEFSIDPQKWEIAGYGAHAEFLAEHWNNLFEHTPVIVNNFFGTSPKIMLRNQNVVIQGKSYDAGSNAYTLEIVKDGEIVIASPDNAGMFYGIQSLIQILAVEKSKQGDKEIKLKGIKIQDYPRFAYRGIHLDVARNFQSKEEVMKLLDVMSFYKLNKFHFHLTDDEGWRIEIPKLPELTQYGAFRGHSEDEKDFLFPAYGSGPDPKNSKSAGNGFYTAEEYKEIVRYAASKYIEVIPEIDVPGHARAAIKAMQKRGEPDFFLHDPNDKSEYLSVQNYPDNVICPCSESTYKFLDLVVWSFFRMHKEAGTPLKTLHIGGDEVPAGVWEKSPLCEKLMADDPKVNSVLDINYYFVRRMNEILRKYNLKTAGWEEVALERKAENGTIKYSPHPEFKGGEVIPYVWNNLWGFQDLGHRLANAGYPVVLCNVTNLYFDLAYNKDPQEPGLTWGGFVDTKSAFDFVPEDVFISTVQDPMGNKFNPADFYATMEKMTPAGEKNILGIQGQLWSETLIQPEMLGYYYFPKLLGLAERAWTPKPSKITGSDWNLFANRISKQQFRAMDALKKEINYRVPPPGVVVKEGKIYVNSEYPGLVLRYTTDGKDPDKKSVEFTQTIDFKENIKIAAFSPSGKRMSKTVVVK
jgi:hexosaminidase